MNDGLERVWKNQPWFILLYYSSSWLEDLKITTENITHDSRSPDRDSNLRVLSNKKREC
jgi:hypothetical protein